MIYKNFIFFYYFRDDFRNPVKPNPNYLLLYVACVTMAVNDILLVVYPIHIVFDKTGMGKILFSLSHRIWVWIRKYFR
jgi:hypothetical protein